MTVLICKTVSEYINADAFKTGYQLIERLDRETEKAFAFVGIGYSAYGNPVRSKPCETKSLESG